MDFQLSDEQRMLQDSVTRFVRDVYAFEKRRDLVASPTGYSADNWATFAEMGWLALPFAEEYGGIGGTDVDMAVMFEALGEGMILEPYLSTVILGGKLVEALGSEAQKQAILPEIASGGLKLALAHEEPGTRYDAALTTTRAEAVGDNWQLNGRKSVVLHAESADKILVIARTDGDAGDRDGLAAFIVDADAKGMLRQDYATIDGQRASDLQLDNVAAIRLGDASTDTLAGLQQVVNSAICAICAEAVGAMAKVHDMTKEYTGMRKQFGKAIGDNQVIQHELVNMFIAVEESKSLTDMTAMRLAEDEAGADAHVSALKAKVGTAARKVGAQGVQLHGGIGMTDEYPVGHFFKRLMAIDMLFGDSAWHLKRYAASI